MHDLLERRDGPGVARLATQLSLLAVTSYATYGLASAGHGAWLLTATAGGLVLPGFFAAIL